MTQESKVAIFSTVSEIYKIVWNQKTYLLLFTIAPTAIITLFIYVEIAFINRFSAVEQTNKVVSILIWYICYVFFGVPCVANWQKIASQQKFANKFLGFFVWRKREAKFAFVALCWALTGLAIAFFLNAIFVFPLVYTGLFEVLAGMLARINLNSKLIMILIELPIAIVMVYVLARLAAVLPATALDAKVGWKGAWILSRRHGVRLVATYIVTFIPIAVLEVIVGTMMTLGLNIPRESLAMLSLEVLFAFIQLIVFATLLSVGFLKLTGWDGCSEPPSCQALAESSSSNE